MRAPARWMGPAMAISGFCNAATCCGVMRLSSAQESGRAA